MSEDSLLGGWLAWLPSLLDGLWLSLEVCVVSLVIGIPLGLWLALLVSAQRKWVRVVAIIAVEIGRGTPALVMLQIVYFGLPSAGLTVGSFTAAVTALALTTGAYTSEILRAGLQAVPHGEVEASAALAMSNRDTLRFIVIPQGVRIAIPALMGFAILIFQATALTFTIALPELLSHAYSIGANTFRYFDVLVLAGLLYLLITLPAGWLTSWTEQRMARHL
jgi:polar amino acid transport system permease protein